MSLELLTICSPLGIRLCTLCLAAGDWSDGAGEDLRPGCHSLPPLLSSFETPIFNAVSSFPSAATPPGLFHPLCTQHVLLPITYGTQNFPYIKTLTQGYLMLREGQGIFDAPKNIAVILKSGKYGGHWKGGAFHPGNNKGMCL